MARKRRNGGRKKSSGSFRVDIADDSRAIVLRALPRVTTTITKDERVSKKHSNSTFHGVGRLRKEKKKRDLVLE